MDLDRNLLFALAAVRANHLSCDQWQECCLAWNADQRASLGDLMVARGWLTPEAREQIERLVEAMLRAPQGDGRAETGQTTSPEDIAPRASAGQGSDDPTDVLGTGPPAGGRSHGSEPTDIDWRHKNVRKHVPVGRPAEQRSRYTLTRVHAEGGIGRVWLAHDEHLNRQVALKEMRPDKQHSRVALHRFRKEAQITSQLEHPNIVPIYELTDAPAADGPFYTMRFIRGRTLREAIDDYHQRRITGEASALELRELLSAFVLICQTVAYAHDRGVLHRDLKPGNIMLGQFGEVVVLDWGLAKIVSPETPDDDWLDFGPIAMSPDALTTPTQYGEVLGTWHYMAPEQALGRINEINQRTDVYGLGAILYAILTGHYPHQGNSTEQIRSAILRQPTPRVRSEAGNVHPALDAICATAMAGEASARYATASQLADDVRRWLADEPVSVYSDSVSSRVGRWLRRHRTWAQAIATALLLIAFVSASAAFIVERARRAEQTARQAERLAQQQALARLASAREALDLALTQMSRELVFYPSVQQLRRTLLARAADEYEKFASEVSDDRILQADAGRAFVRLGDVHQLLEQPDRAAAAYQRAESYFDELTGRSLWAAQARRKRAEVLAAQGASAAAVALATQALDELQQLGGLPEARVEWSRCQVLLARWAWRAGAAHEARNRLRDAVAELRIIVDADARPRHRRELIEALGSRAEVLSESGDRSGAIAALSEAAKLAAALVTLDPDHPDYLDTQAVTAIRLAHALGPTGRFVEEIDAYQQAIDSYVALVKARPEIAVYRYNLADAQASLAQLFHYLGENETARQHADQAIREFSYLISHYPESLDYYEGLAIATITLGRALFDLGRDHDASRQLEGAVRLFEEPLLTSQPHDYPYLRGLGIARGNLARVRLRQSQRADALTLFDQAVVDLQAALAQHADPDSDHQTRNALAWVQMRYGDALWESGQQESARERYTAAIDLRNALPPDAEYLDNFAWLLVTCQVQEMRDPARAIELARQATQATPENPHYWFRLAYAQYQAGDLAACRVALDLAAQARPAADKNSFDLLLLALVHARSSQLESAQQTYDEALRSRFAQENAGNADLIRLRQEVESVLRPQTAPEQP